MDSKVSPAQANPHHDGDVPFRVPKDWANAEEALSKLAQVASDRSRPAVGADFSADPRVTEPSLDATIRLADVSDDPLATNPTSSRLARSLLIFCVGVAATLAWQSFGGAARQMIADSAPQLSWLSSSPPAMDQPSRREIDVDQPSPPAVQASAPQVASEKPGPVPSTASETPASTALADLSLALRQLETMSHDVAAVRESVERLAAGQEQIVREIAELQTDRQDTPAQDIGASADSRHHLAQARAAATTGTSVISGAAPARAAATRSSIISASASARIARTAITTATAGATGLTNGYSRVTIEASVTGNGYSIGTPLRLTVLAHGQDEATGRDGSTEPGRA